MHDDSANAVEEREVIELPEEPPGAGRRSPLAKAVLWVALLSLGASAMYVMYFRSVSQASGAIPAGNVAPMLTGTSAQLTDFLASDQAPIAALRATLNQSRGTLESLLDDSLPRQIPLAELRCNPFRQPDLSAPASHAPPTTAPSAPHQQEAQRAAMLQAVEAMQLQSIAATGSQRSCMINNVLYDEGGIINGFVIEQINPQSVVIQNGLYHFELTMNR